MGTRAELQAYLQTIADTVNGRVYYQPPEDVKLSYPCIIYKRGLIESKHANNKAYMYRTRYDVTLIDHDPDSAMIPLIVETELADFSTHFTADNLNHDVFTLYY